MEYLDGKLSIHEGKEYRVMTNSPRYDYQLAINDYWKEIGGLQMLHFESTLASNMFWLDLKKIDFSPKAEIKKMSLTKGGIYAGDAVKDLKGSQSFTFLFETPVM